MRIVLQSGNGQIGMEALNEGNDESRGILSCCLQHYQDNRDDDADQELQEQLAASGQPEIAMMNYLEIIIGETNRRKAQRRNDGDPNILVRQIRPQQRRNDDGYGDEHPAHGGRTRLLLMRSRSLFTDILANLKFSELPDYAGSNDQSDEECR